MKTTSNNFPQIIEQMNFRSVYDDAVLYEIQYPTYYGLAISSGSTIAIDSTMLTPLGVGAVTASFADESLHSATFSPLAVGDIGAHVGLVLRADRDYDDDLSLKFTESTSSSATYQNVNISSSHHGLRAGEWTTIWLKAADFTGGGSPSPEAWCTTSSNQEYSCGRMIVTVDTRAASGAGDPGALVLDIAGLLHYTPEKAKVIIHFDAPYASSYTNGFSAMKKKGWKGVLPVITDNVDAADYWTTAQLQEAYDDGWDLINKTSEHHGGQTTDAIADFFPQFIEGRKALVDAGWTRTADLMQYPSNRAVCSTYDAGDYLENIGVYGRGALARPRYRGKAYKLSSNIADAIFNDDYITSTHGPIVPNDWLATQFTSMDLWSDNDYTAGLDDAVEAAVFGRGVLQLYCHHIDDDTAEADGITTGLFEALLDDLETYELAGTLEVITISDWMNEVNGNKKFQGNTSGRTTTKFPKLVSSMSEEILSNYTSGPTVGGTGVTAVANTATVTPIGTGVIDWTLKKGQICTIRFNIGTVGTSSTNAHFGPHIGIVFRSSTAIRKPITFYMSATGQQSVSYSVSPNQNMHGVQPGEWTVIWLCRDNLTKIGAAADWCTTTSNQSFDVQRFDIAISAEENALVEFAGVVTYTPPKAKLIFQFDDNYSGVYNEVYPRFKAKGWTGTVPIVKNKVGSSTSFMTLAQIQALYAAGWDIINHSSDHFIDGKEWPVSSGNYHDMPATWFPQFVENRQYLVDNGLTRTADMIVYPGNQAILNTNNGGELIGDICSWARGQAAFKRYGNKGYYSGRVDSIGSCIIPNEPLSIPYMAMYSYSTTDYSAGMDDFITNIVNTREVGIVYAHDISASPSSIGISIDFLEDMIDAVSVYEDAGLLEVTTGSKWMDEVNGSAGSVSQSTSTNSIFSANNANSIFG